MAQRPALPIDAILGDIEAALQRPGCNAVIQAAPGAGKTTAIPLHLLGPQGLLAKRRDQGLADKVLILEPRRIAARMAAQTCANWSDGKLGNTVGYQVRFERATSEHTQLCFVTQALYLRILLGSPQLEGYGLVIFDEFHERNLASDLALALTLGLQKSARPDLQIIAMSATLDAGPVANYLNAESFSHEGRSFPVQIHHSSYQRKQVGTANALLRVLHQIDAENIPGHVLVFLPGLAAIEKQAKLISSWTSARGIEVHRLHGSMNKAAQQNVVAPSGQRKIILATNVAESSVTIPGIGIVVDFGTAKISRCDLLTGKTLLEEKAISRASAVQRSGRAGRTAPGVAFRLYSEADFKRRAAFERPEVERLDPSSTLLAIAALGYDPQRFPWFEPPKDSQLQASLQELESLELVRDRKITPIGELAAQLPLSPSAARCVVELGRGDLEMAAKIGALLSVDDKTLGALRKYMPASDESDLLAELSAWRMAKKRRAGVEACLKQLEQHESSIRATLRRHQSALKQLGPGLQSDFSTQDQESWVRCCIALGHLRALGKIEDPNNPGSRIVMAQGGSAYRHESSTVTGANPWVVVLSSQERAGKTQAQRLSAVEEEWLLELGSGLESKTKVSYLEARQEVRATQALMIGQVVVEEQELDTLPPAGVDLLYKKSMAAGLANFFDLPVLQQFLARCAFVKRYRPDTPVPTMEDVQHSWRALCSQHTRFSQLKDANFLAQFRYEYQEHLGDIDTLAPTHIKLPSGRRLALSYEGEREPGISSRLQDFFGSKSGPAIMQGQVPLRLHLLAPNGRDVQVTTDLAGFWERHYPGLRKTLMRRYPKHAWPEDPENAEPPKPRPRRPRKK